MASKKKISSKKKRPLKDKVVEETKEVSSTNTEQEVTSIDVNKEVIDEEEAKVLASSNHGAKAKVLASSKDNDAPKVTDETTEKPKKEEAKVLASSNKKKSSKQKVKENDADIEEGLEAIYGTEKVDFTKVERKQTRLTSILLTVVITLAIVAVTAWTGFLIYQKYFAENTEKHFEVSIEIPNDLVSGQLTTITIDYSNPTNVSLADLQIDANLPTAFHMQKAEPGPSDLEELIWEIGSLAAGSDESITIEGVWIAEVPSSTPIQVFANYRPSNFNADFQEISTIYVNTISSALETTFEGAEEGQPGQILEYKFHVTNNGDEAIENVEIALELPNGFFLENSEPAVEPGAAAIWEFENLEPEQSETVTLNGSFAADTEGFQYFKLETRIKDNNRSLLQNSVEGFTDVVGDNLSIQLVANGSTNNVTADMGGNLRIALSLENTGESDIDDASLLLDFQSDDSIPLNWNDSELDGGAITSDGILWSNASLGTLTPGEKRILNVTFPIRGSVTENHADVFTVLAAASVGDLTIKSTPVTVMILSEASFAAEARYYTENGAPLGSGPVPPSVGASTTYRIFWDIDNFLHDLENIRVQAILPPHVTWKNQFDADLGSISFDEDARTVLWDIASMPKNITNIQATFSISVTPDDDDIGTFVKLISGSTMTATDSVTGTTITNSTESLTTELPNDDFANEKGIVE